MWTLTWQLVLAVLVFPITGLVVITLVVLGGAKVLSSHDVMVIALIAGAAAASALIGVVYEWFEHRSAPVSVLAYLMIGIAAVLVIAGTLAFATAPSPRNTGRPSVSGTPQVTAVLAARPGRWNEPRRDLDFHYKWQRCGASCDDIVGATARSYVVRQPDLGKRIRVSIQAESRRPGWREFASNTAYSSETPLITH
jgi:hypothetical protein